MGAPSFLESNVVYELIQTHGQNVETHWADSFMRAMWLAFRWTRCGGTYVTIRRDGDVAVLASKAGFTRPGWVGERAISSTVLN